MRPAGQIFHGGLVYVDAHVVIERCKNLLEMHWPLRRFTPQAIGTTDRLGGEPAERPVHFQEGFATLYHNMGIDVNKATVKDLSGRPHFLVDGYQPMRELI